MPFSGKRRFTVDFEKMFWFTKSRQYYFETQYEQSVSEHTSGNGFKRPNRLVMKGRGSDVPWQPTDLRNKRTVWAISIQPYKGAHVAVFPEELPETPIKATCPPFGVVLDPFMGAGTTGLVAQKLARHYVGIELSLAYIADSTARLKQPTLRIA